MNRALTCVLLLGVLCTAYAVDVEEEVHDADTPVRQAQRAMLAERDAATAAHAEEDVLGMRLAEVSAETEAPQPHARRISGAAKSFTPNDKMCVMCQFLAQRIQQELAGGFGGVASMTAGVNMPSYQFMSSVGASAGASFMEMLGADEDEEAADESDEELIEVVDEDEAKAEDEDEAEEEESDEAEEESEEETESEDEEESEADEEIDELLDAAESDDAEFEAEEDSEEDAFLELSSDEGESDSDEWTAPEYTAEAAPEPTPIALVEADSQTPTFVDAEEEQTSAEESTEEAETEATEAAQGTADEVEPAFFESAAVAATESDSEWTTPEFVAEAAAPKAEMVEAEMTAFLETETGADDSEGEWTTPEFSNAQAASNGAKSYARVIVPAESEQSLIEAAAENTVASNEAAMETAEIKLFAPRIIRSRASKRRPVIFHTLKRYRSADAIVPRPRWNRHDPHSPRHMANRSIAGMALRNAEAGAYDRLEQYCSTRLPEAYGKYCRPVLRQFRRITEGLSYGDHIDRVCMNINLCKKNSYVSLSPHVRLSERN